MIFPEETKSLEVTVVFCVAILSGLPQITVTLVLQ